MTVGFFVSCLMYAVAGFLIGHFYERISDKIGYVNYFTKTSERNKALWETYAIAQEATLDCIKDLEEKVAGEGYRTRAKRRAKLYEQMLNSRTAAVDALEQLIEAGEYV